MSEQYFNLCKITAACKNHSKYIYIYKVLKSWKNALLTCESIQQTITQTFWKFARHDIPKNQQTGVKNTLIYIYISIPY